MFNYASSFKKKQYINIYTFKEFSGTRRPHQFPLTFISDIFYQINQFIFQSESLNMQILKEFFVIRVLI